MLLLTRVLPYELVVVPLYQQEQSMGILNTRGALILPLIGLNVPFAIFWMRAHFITMPAQLSEADSASLALLMLLSTWNQFLLALVLISNPADRTMAGALQAFVTKYGTNEVLLNAGALLMIAPTIIVFPFLQRHFVKALLKGAVKG